MARIYLTGTLLLSTVIAFLTLSHGHDWGDDFAEYLLQAESIVEGRVAACVEANRFTIDNSTELIGPHAYPWGFPLCLAPAVRLVGLDMIALKCLNLAFFGLMLPCVYVLMVPRLGKPASCLLTALLAFNPNIIGMLDHLLSDVPFTFFAMLTMYLLDRSIVRRRDRVHPIVSGILIGARAFCAAFTRPNGVLLLPVIFLCQVMAYRTSSPAAPSSRAANSAMGLIPYAVFGLLKVLGDALLPDGSANHIDSFRFSWTNTAVNALYYFQQYAMLFGAPVGREIVFALSLPLALIGVRARWRQDHHFLAFCGLNMALYIVWPGHNGMRYLLPMLPFYLYFTFQGVIQAWDWMPFARFQRYKTMPFGRLASVAGVMVALGLLLESAYAAGCNLRVHAGGGRQTEGPFDQASSELFAFIRTDTPPDARLLFFKPRTLRLLTGRAGFASNRLEDIARVDYVVIHKGYDPCNQVKPPSAMRLQAVFDNGTFTVYRTSAVFD